MSKEEKRPKGGQGIIEITRTYDGIKFIESNLPKDTEEKILADVPLGNPTQSFMYVKTFGELCVYHFFNGSSDRSLIGIVTAPIKALTQSILFYPEVQTINERINADHQNKLIETRNLSCLTNLANLEGLLYAFFVGKPIILIGDEPYIRETTIALCTVAPNWISQRATFISNVSQRIDSIQILGVQPGIVPSLNPNDSETIVNLSQNHVYALYDCETTIKISNLLKTGKIDELEGEKSNLENRLLKIRDATVPVEVADLLHCSMAEAEFLTEINQHFIEYQGGQNLA